jgi:hypothetical protein
LSLISTHKSPYRKQSLTITLTTLYLSPRLARYNTSPQTLLFTDSLLWRTDFFSPTSYPLNGLTGIYVYDAYVYTLDMPCKCCLCCVDLEMTLIWNLE